MATINLSLPDGLNAYVEDRAQAGHYTTASDYIRELIRRDREREEAIAELQGLIDEGLESGVSDRSMDDVLTEARLRARAIQRA